MKCIVCSQLNNAIRSIFLISLFICFCPAGFSQTGSIKGKITDATGNPLSRATVKIKASNNATNTDVRRNIHQAKLYEYQETIQQNKNL